MSEYRKRMAEMGRLALPPDELDRLVAEYKARGIAPSREDKKRWDLSQALFWAQQHNGAEFEPEESIRYFHREYNSRTWKHGLLSLPASFNVLEAFFNYIPELVAFRIRREVDHLFSLEDFLAIITSPDFDATIEEASGILEEGLVYSYSNIDQMDSLTIAGDKEYAVAGFAFVRHGAELSILMVAGERADLKEQSGVLSQADFKTLWVPAGKERIKSAPELVREAVPLLDHPDFWKLIAATRLDLNNRTMQVRYMLHDCGDYFSTMTDDPVAFLDEKGEFLGPGAKESAEAAAKAVQERASLFEICVTGVFLPLYFDRFGDRVVEERHPTRYGKNVKKASYDKVRKLAPPEERLAFRRVSVLRKEHDQDAAGASTFVAPEFKVEVSGYWSRLEHGKVGADRYGNTIHGKTWVHKRLSWMESSATGRSLSVHHPGQGGVPALGANSGIIYVMRSAVHPRNVFKVGFTLRTSDSRARELSSSTASPDKFFVMYEWEVLDAKVAEGLIHERLDVYRLNPWREFFQADLKVIVAVITEVVGLVNGNP